MDWDQMTLLTLIVGASEFLGILTAIHNVMTTRTPQGAIAWFFPLVLFPIIALPLYWIFGRSRFSGYLVTRRRGETLIQQRVTDGLGTYGERYGACLDDERGRFRVLEELARLPFSAGNRVDLLIDGEATFDAIFAAIDSAEKYLLVQFFIIHDDQLGRELQRRLIDRAENGVQVYLLYDEIGSHRLPQKYLDKLTAAGAACHAFHSTRGWSNRFQLNFRNHRKIVVVDGEVGFVGGHNVGDEYMGRDPQFGHWRDTHLAIRGPAVTCIQLAFTEDWHWATGEILEHLRWETPAAEEPGQNLLILPTGPADDLESCGMFYTHLIHTSRKRCWIASPYFVPDREVITALQIAALRGVDVRILLPARPDHLLVYLSSFVYIDESSPVGVQFYRYEPGFLHQKVILVDDDFAAVGTANLDNRSFRLNFEITAAVVDADFNAAVAEMLERDFANSRELSKDELSQRSFQFRLACRASRLMAPVQ